MQRFAFPIFALVMLALPFLPVPEFWITQMNTIGMASLVALGLVLLTGVAGLTSFGQAAFVGVGAYTAAYLAVHLHVSPWLTLPIGMAICVVVALVLGFVTLRMSGHFLPLATIAWALAINYTVANVDALGKYDGIQGIPPLSAFGIDLGSPRAMAVLIWAFALLAAWGVMNLLDSRIGRAVRALPTGSTMPEAMGVSTFRTKMLAFVLAAVLASVAGWLFAHFQRTVNPSPFSLHKGIEYLFMAVLGGIGHVWGAFLGAGVVVLLEDVLQDVLPKLFHASGNFEIIVFGLILIAVLKWAPDGLWSFVGRFVPRRQRQRDWEAAEALPARPKPERGTDLLVVDKVRKQFGGLTAVNDVSFTLRAGDIVALIGPNGAGKSTTFNLVTGVLPLTSGQVSWQGRAIGGKSSRQIAEQGISRTFQHVKLVPDMTVLENVAIGCHLRSSAGALGAVLRTSKDEERRIFREAEKQLQRIGMGDVLNEQAGNLALGPQRLLEIARALCSDPALLLLDEPAAGLRLQEKEALARVLRQLKQEGLTILLVEHDMDFVMGLADRIVVMEFGTRLIEGTPLEVQASPAVRAAYLGTEH